MGIIPKRKISNNCSISPEQTILNRQDKTREQWRRAKRDAGRRSDRYGNKISIGEAERIAEDAHAEQVDASAERGLTQLTRSAERAAATGEVFIELSDGYASAGREYTCKRAREERVGDQVTAIGANAMLGATISRQKA